MPVPRMNAPFFEIGVRFRSGGRSMLSRHSNAGPEQTWRSVVFYSDNTTRVEQLAQTLSCLINRGKFQWDRNH
jgi:hypothetical protein